MAPSWRPSKATTWSFERYFCTSQQFTLVRKWMQHSGWTTNIWMTKWLSRKQESHHEILVPFRSAWWPQVRSNRTWRNWEQCLASQSWTSTFGYPQKTIWEIRTNHSMMTIELLSSMLFCVRYFSTFPYYMTYIPSIYVPLFTTLLAKNSLKSGVSNFIIQGDINRMNRSPRMTIGDAVSIYRLLFFLLRWP